jgi:hypothetical protein
MHPVVWLYLTIVSPLANIESEGEIPLLLLPAFSLIY